MMKSVLQMLAGAGVATALAVSTAAAVPLGPSNTGRAVENNDLVTKIQAMCEVGRGPYRRYVPCRTLRGGGHFPRPYGSTRSQYCIDMYNVCWAQFRSTLSPGYTRCMASRGCRP